MKKTAVSLDDDDVVFMAHALFGFFTGHGWSGQRGTAKAMTYRQAREWLKLFQTMVNTDHDVPFALASITFFKEADAPEELPTQPHGRQRNPAIDPPAHYYL